MNKQNSVKEMINHEICNLTKLQVGESAVVVDIVGDTNQYYRHRLLAQGVVPGEILKIKNAAPLGDPIEVTLSSGRSFIVRRQEANIIAITRLDRLQK